MFKRIPLLLASCQGLMLSCTSLTIATSALVGVTLGLSCTLQAQVYKSTDADGNVIFSDTPTPDSEEVVIPEPNLADPVEVPEYVPPPEPQPKAAEPINREAELELVGKSYEYDRRRDRHRWKEIRPRAGPANSQK